MIQKLSYVNRPRITFRRNKILQKPIVKPLPTPQNRSIQARSFPYEVETYLIGKSIIAFVFFYTSLNWFYYKQTREEMEAFYKSDAKEIKPTKKKEEKNE